MDARTVLQVREIGRWSCWPCVGARGASSRPRRSSCHQIPRFVFEAKISVAAQSLCDSMADPAANPRCYTSWCLVVRGLLMVKLVMFFSMDFLLLPCWFQVLLLSKVNIERLTLSNVDCLLDMSQTIVKCVKSMGAELVRGDALAPVPKHERPEKLRVSLGIWKYKCMFAWVIRCWPCFSECAQVSVVRERGWLQVDAHRRFLPDSSQKVFRCT